MGSAAKIVASVAAERLGRWSRWPRNLKKISSAVRAIRFGRGAVARWMVASQERRRVKV
jgi:hypothetical protein